MSLLNSNQRAVVALDTGIDRLIVDRCTEAFDALIERGDVETYTKLMHTAWAQMGYEQPVTEADKPTALDKIKTVCLHAYADREHIPYKRAQARLARALSGA